MSLDDEWAGAKPVNLQAEWDGASKQRTPPTKLKIGAEGFEDAMRQTMKEAGPVSQFLAGFGSFPRQIYEGTKQAAGDFADWVSPKERTLSSLVTGQAPKRQYADPLAIKATRIMEQEAPVSALAGGLATMVPLSMIPGANTVAGQAAFGTATGALMPTLEGESRGMNALTGGLTGAGTAIALKGIGAVTRPWLQRGQQQASEKAVENAVRDRTLTEGRAAGYVIPGSAVGEQGAGHKAVESIAGKAALGQEASIRNQAVTNKIAKTEAGLRPDDPITELSLAAARERIAQPYREVAALSKRAGRALDDLKQVRSDAKAHWQFYNRSADPKALKEAQALDAKADKLEGVIEAEAKKVIQAGPAMRAQNVKGLPERLKEARVALAKNYTVEKAVNLGNGNVDAAILGRLYNKVGEKGMTGGLATIAKFQQAFPDFMRAKPPTQVAPGVGALKPYAAALGLGLGAEYGREHYGISPYMMGAAALPLIGGPARSLALSKLMQHVPAYEASAARRLADAAAKSPFLPAAATGVTLQQLSQQ